MDEQGFDRLARATVGRSRRAVVKALAGAAAGGLLAALGGRRAGVAGDKVLICHLTGSETNPVVLLKVSVNAVPAHEAHRDAIDPDFSSDPAHCGGCGSACGAGESCVAGSCQGCGGLDQACCAESSCDPGLTCAELGTCRDCGEVGEPCCVTFATLFCNAGAVCADGICVGCDPANVECAPPGND